MIEIKESECRERGLPPVSLRVANTTGLAIIDRFPDARTYVSTATAPGGGPMLLVRPCPRGQGIEDVVRAAFDQPYELPLEIHRTFTVALAGAPREAVEVSSGVGPPIPWCVVRVDTPVTGVMIGFGVFSAMGAIDARDLLAQPTLAAIASSISVAGA